METELKFTSYEPIELSAEDLQILFGENEQDPFSPYNFQTFTDTELTPIKYVYVLSSYNEEQPEKEEKLELELEKLEEKKELPKLKLEEPAPLPGTMYDKNKFAKTLLSTYKRVLKNMGYNLEYAYVLTASAIMESGWGRKLGAPYNYGGVMNFSGDGKHTLSWTWNYKNGKLERELSKFRNFDSMEDYCTYIVHLMKNTPYQLFKKYSPNDPVTAWYNILKSGYGGTTDAGKLSYAEDVGSIVKTLKKYK